MPRLVTQLCGLERRTARGGKDSIDHAPSSHDDVINSAAEAIVLAAQHAHRPAFGFYSGGRVMSSAIQTAVEVSGTLEEAAKVVTRTFTTPATRSAPVPTRRRSYEEMALLEQSDLSEEERKRFAEETARRQRNRQPSPLEELARLTGSYFPEDGHISSSSGDLSAALVEVRRKVATW